MDYSLPGSSVHGDSPGKNTGVGCHTLLQGIFPTRELNHVSYVPCNGRRVPYHQSHLGTPHNLKTYNEKKHTKELQTRQVAIFQRHLLDIHHRPEMLSTEEEKKEDQATIIVEKTVFFFNILNLKM